MQDKVHFTPPVVHLYQGKPPPTSWVQENIVRFFEIKNQHEFLTDLKSFLQNKASENLAKTKQSGKLVLEFSYLPEGEGSAKEIATASQFNLMQTHVGTEIQFLIKLVQIAKEGNPTAAKELDEALAQLKGIVTAFPRISQEELNRLENLMNRLLEMAKKMNPSAQKAFWEELNKMLEKMYKANGASVQQLQDESEKAKSKGEELANLKNAMQSALSLLSSGQIQEGLSKFTALLKNYKNLPPDLREIFGNALSKAGRMSGKNIALPQLLAEAQLSQWIKKMGGKATREEFVDFVQRQMKEPPFNSMSPPFMSDFLGAIHKTSTHPDFPSVASSLGPKYDEGETFSQSVDSFNFDPVSAKSASEDVEDYLGGKQRDYENKSVGFGEAAREGARVGDGLGRSAAGGAVHGASSGGGLPNDFQKAILNHYMPGQEKYLMELAELLMFDNMGAEIGNALLNITSDFGSAGINYGFGNFLAGQKGKDEGNGVTEYSGSASQAKANLSKETQAAYRDRAELSQAINKIDSEIKRIENDKNLTSTQKKKLISKLKNIRANLKVAHEQVDKLYKLLKTIHISPTKDGKGYYIEGRGLDWHKELTDDEDAVVNGDPKSDPKGGLVPISSEINGFQQNYADQGQNQQMMLQMRMTEIQQEWTVVSTALQILNQVYMSLAQGIYK
ncbi:MAG: hypothetical protein JJU12_04230 [Chlamydiales bacterium]|nr:hypothetical protein [Chlamydiales bacterium]